jgi:hypothetical protein
MCQVTANQQPTAPHLNMQLISYSSFEMNHDSSHSDDTTRVAYADEDNASHRPDSSSSDASISMVSHADRSLECIDYLIARTEMDLQLAIRKRDSLLAELGLQSSETDTDLHAEAVASSDVSSDSLALISPTDRSNECIEYLIARTQMELEISLNASILLRESFLGELERCAFLAGSNFMALSTHGHANTE